MREDSILDSNPPLRCSCRRVNYLALLLAALSPIQLARLQYGGGGDWYNDPDALPNLAREISERTSILATEEQKVLTLMDREIENYPILYMTGHGKVSFSKAERERLREYLRSGGFLYADDDYGMDESFRAEIAEVFPNSELVELPYDHLIYHIFYDFANGPPQTHKHVEGPPKGFGLFDAGRLVIFYTVNSNPSDGWTVAHNNPPDVREHAFRMGINIVLYALLN
ncbi:hypothetical protein ES703_02507 [subsurface metagenome]|nr:DUF4159 domain-containing protein [bacterium]